MSDAAAVPDYRAMSRAQRLDALADLERQAARLAAQRARLLAVIDPDPTAACDAAGELDKHWDREEVALILRLSSGTVRSVLCEAVDLVTRFPATLALLEAGQLSAAMARRLVEACVPLPDPVAAAVEDRVLTRGPVQSLSQFAASVRRAVLTLAPARAEQQHADARAQRAVAFTHRGDGTSELWAHGLDGAAAVAIETELRQLARQWQREHADDPRSSDQRRADALVALLLGHPAATDRIALHPSVHVTVALSTLLGADQQPGELDGHGPIPATVARALAFDPTGTWRRLLSDPNQRLVDLSTDTYRPPANMARLVRAEHPTCRFPGCRRRARHDDLDHITARVDGGRTAPANLQPLCGRHHHLKHETRWTVHREPDGTTIWRSPTGRSYAKPLDERPVDTTSDPPHNDAA